MTLSKMETAKSYQPDETGCCLNCRRGREAHPVEEQCPVGRRNPMPEEAPENVIAYEDRKPGDHGRPLRQQRTRRHFVTRGGELVEVEQVMRETR